MLYPKTFYYKIEDPSCSNPIKVDIEKYKTVSELKTQIALDLHISDSDVQIINPYAEDDLLEIPLESEFSVNIFHRCYNIVFIFADYSRIQIPNSYRMTIDEVLQYFEQNQIHFSSTSKNLIQFTVSNQEVPHNKYPFLAIPDLTPVQITMPCQPVTIAYGNKKFIFTEQDSVSEVINELEILYPYCSSVTIRNELGHRINFWSKLRSDVNYDIFIGFQVQFFSIDNSITFTKKIDFLSTVGSARSKIADEINKSGMFIVPEKVILYDNEKNVISGAGRALSSIQWLSKPFYFEIDNELSRSGSSMASRDEIARGKLGENGSCSSLQSPKCSPCKERNACEHDKHSSLQSPKHSSHKDRNACEHDKHSSLQSPKHSSPRSSECCSYKDSYEYDRCSSAYSSESYAYRDIDGYERYSSPYSSESCSRKDGNGCEYGSSTYTSYSYRSQRKDHSYDDSLLFSKEKKKERSTKKSCCDEKEKVEPKDISSDLTSDLSECESDYDSQIDESN